MSLSIAGSRHSVWSEEGCVVLLHLPNPSVSSSPKPGRVRRPECWLQDAVRGLPFPSAPAACDEDKETAQQRSEKAELDQTDKHPINLKAPRLPPVDSRYRPRNRSARRPEAEEQGQRRTSIREDMLRRGRRQLRKFRCLRPGSEAGWVSATCSIPWCVAARRQETPCRQ